MDQWFFAQPGEQPRGPVSVDELRGFVAGGQMAPEALCWHAGMAQWLPVSATPELSGIATGAPTQRAAAPAARHPEPNTPAAPRASSGFLRSLHRLPKPVLFGLYGALGGLLGALLLGELLWLV